MKATVLAFLKFLRTPKFLKTLGFFFLGAFLGGCLLLVFLILFIFGLRSQYQSRIYPGVFLGSVSVSGKTAEELADLLSQQEARIAKQKVIFRWPTDEKVNWEIAPVTVDFSLDQTAISQEVFSLGRKETGLASFAELTRLLLFSQTVEPKFNFSQVKLEETVASISAVVDRPVKEALFDFKAGRVVNFQASQIGRNLEREQVKNLLILAFSQASSTKDILTLDLPVTEMLPKVTTDQTNNLGIKEPLGEGESFFFDSISSRVHNIALAVSYLRGVVLAPGEIFSFAQKVGTVSAETGYQQAYVIREKKTILEDGGGVCQVSTTLFRAALNAGLPIVERQAHYYRVGFYEQGGYPPGLDATVYPPSPDFKFKNDTSAYILIQASVDKEKKRLAFTLYGTPDGRKVQTQKPVIHEKTEPPEPVYIDDPTLPAGQIKRQDQAHWGAKVSFKRKVWAANGGLKEEKEFWSNYTAWPAVYLRGTKTE